ncbi:MAG: transglycosylase SLT domain-containing protein [Chitinispirillia bacterium]|nr:transglycosylase SLT domain-containing protein [Chitinispirillia bacterium]MCL2242134.1 transglycosylase SLT domain-containing protein [Chitinispirillia bacterium]
MVISNNTISTQASQANGQPLSRAAQAAREFEAMFTSMMFKAMRGSISSEGSLIPKGMGEEVFTEMLDGEYARMSAESGSLGLAALILKEIERNEGKDAPSLDNNTPLWAMGHRYGAASKSQAYHGSGGAALIGKVNAQWETLIENISGRYGVDKDLVTAVIARESAGNPRAISPKGAKGLMQLMDGTARDMGVKSSFSPAENIMGGVKYLKMMLDMHGGNENLALASYNAGPGAVKRFNGIPPYKETQEYVKAVQNLRAKAAGMKAAHEAQNTSETTGAAKNGAKNEAI